MKKSELKATLGSIKASDELVRRTVLAAEERKHKQEKRTSIFNLTFGMRLAGVACALMLTVGVVTAVLGKPSPDVQGDAQHAKEMTIVCTDSDPAESKDGTSDPVEVLLSDSVRCTGDWAILRGEIHYASVLSNSEEDRYALDVKLSVRELAHSSDGISDIGDQISAVAVFADDSHRQRMIDSIGEDVTLLIEQDSDGRWLVTRVIY